MITNLTPVESHVINGVEIRVKREDLCCPFPGPSFSKIRGVVAHIKNRPQTTIGVLDTLHSKAGWAVAYVCQHLGKQAVDYWPMYKKDQMGPSEPWPPRIQQRHAKDLGAVPLALTAGRSAILYHSAKKLLRENWHDSYMMPNALKLPESITENAAEVVRTYQAGLLPGAGTYVISISSGTVAAGVLLGLADVGVLRYVRIILHMGYSRSQDAVRSYLEKCVGEPLPWDRIELVDEGYGYADTAPKTAQAPFPCNAHYDLKAWSWLTRPENLSRVVAQGPIVFWNIGD